MRSFLYKTLAFLILIFLISQGVKLFVPYHWGNVWYSTKIQHLERESEQPTHVFIGSSRIYRELMPNTFDSVVNEQTGQEIASFNLGAPATFCPQTYYLLEQWLASEASQGTETVFLELMSVTRIGGGLKHQERTTYWQNFNDVSFASQVLVKRYGRLKGGADAAAFWTAYTENLFGIGHFRDALLTENYFDDAYLGAMRDGFYPAELHMKETTDEKVRTSFQERSEALKMESFEKRKARINEVLDGKTAYADPLHTERIEHLIQLADDRGIELIFVVTPTHLDPVIYTLYQNLPSEYRLGLSNEKEYRELYTLPNLFDIGHLNEDGAEQWTAMIAKEYSDHLNTDKRGINDR